MSDWWTKDLSSLFPLPSLSDLYITHNISNFGLLKHDNSFNERYIFNNLVLNNLILNKLPEINDGNVSKKIIDKYNKNVLSIQNSTKYKDKQKQTALKTINTKKNKALSNVRFITHSQKANLS